MTALNEYNGHSQNHYQVNYAKSHDNTKIYSRDSKNRRYLSYNIHACYSDEEEGWTPI